jgi:hypothetical protein
VVAQGYNPNYVGSSDQRILVEDQPKLKVSEITPISPKVINKIKELGGRVGGKGGGGGRGEK